MIWSSIQSGDVVGSVDDAHPDWFCDVAFDPATSPLITAGGTEALAPAHDRLQFWKRSS